MNSHLNVFKTYTKENRTYQLENDLTRALAICMQEDPLFFHEVLKCILDDDTFNLLFSSVEVDNQVSIEIQVNTKNLSSFEKIIAVSLSDFKMSEEHFWGQDNSNAYDPICDLVLKINDTLVIIEAKRDGVDCTSQLYNQVFNVLKHTGTQNTMRESVTPVDLNWRRLIEIAARVLSFERSVGSVNRFTLDFMNLVKGHNPHWIPETPIAALTLPDTLMIKRRVESALNFLDVQEGFTKLNYSERTGLRFNKPWAQEVLFEVKSETGELIISVYPGNTKPQGAYMFSTGASIAETVTVAGQTYPTNKAYHMKFTSFQKYFTGLWFYDGNLKKEGLYSREMFNTYAGRNLKATGQWDRLEILFDEYFKEEYDWRKHMDWNGKVVGSGKSQFDLSFGYGISVVIPFSELKAIDKDSNKVDGLATLIKSCYSAFENDLIVHRPSMIATEEEITMSVGDE